MARGEPAPYTPEHLLGLAKTLVTRTDGSRFENLALAERFTEAAVRAEVRCLDAVNSELTALEGRSSLRLV